MQNCHLRFELGKPQENQPAQWLEGEFRLSPDNFGVEAHICARWEEDAYSQHTVALGVEQPFSAEAFLDLLELLCQPPFEPPFRDLRLDSSGNPVISNGEIARIVDPELMAASVGPSLPAVTSQEVEEKLVRIARTRAIESGAWLVERVLDCV